MAATHKSRWTPTNFHSLWTWPRPKGSQELLSQGYINHFRRVYLCWEEGEREQCSCTEGLRWLLGDDTLSWGVHWQAITSFLSQWAQCHCSLVPQAYSQYSTMLHCPCRNSAMTTLPCSRHGNGAKARYKPSAWFWRKVQLTGGGTGMTVREGELFISRVRLVIARILTSSSRNKGEL